MAKKPLIYRWGVYSGMPRVIFLLYMPAYGFLAISLLSLYFSPAYWFYPSVISLLCLVAIYYADRIGKKAESKVSPEFQKTFRQGRLAAKFLAPLFGLAIGYVTWDMQKDSPPKEYLSLFSFEEKAPQIQGTMSAEEAQIEGVGSNVVKNGLSGLQFLTIVRNTGSQPILSLKIYVQALSKSEAFLGQYDSYLYFSYLLPNEEAPLFVHINDGRDFDHYNLRFEIERGEVAEIVSLKLLDTEWSFDGSFFRFRGKVLNDSESKVAFPYVALVVFDSKGIIQEIDNSSIQKNDLEPGEKADFSMSVFSETRPKKYKVFTGSQ